MEHEFWHNAWDNGRQGWHQKSINQHLETWWGKFNADASEPVFVPLCGKSLDMLWLLGQGHPVTGVELNEGAVRAFFEENGIPATQQKRDNFHVYHNAELSIYTGDFFKLTHSELNETKFVFDRAALIALPPAMRRDYVEKMKDILNIGSKIFLITTVYDENEMSGPPFSVEDEEVRDLFSTGFDVEKVESSDDPAMIGGLSKRGLTSLVENIWFMTKTS